MTTDRRAPVPAAFTLLEMIVVLGLIAAFMALAMGGFMAFKRQTPLLATEHLVADLLRQARHQARTSGAPAIITFTKDQGEVMGLTRTTVVSMRFEEGEAGADGQPVATPDPTKRMAGSAGAGLLCPDNVDPQANATYLPEWATRPIGSRQRLSRGEAAGFYIACDVLAPDADQASGMLPLITISDENAALDGSICGLCLWGGTKNVQDYQALGANSGSGPATTAGSTSLTAVTPYWDVVGWVNLGGTRTEVSAADTDNVEDGTKADGRLDQQRPQGAGTRSVTDMHVTAQGSKDIYAPLTGRRWTTIGLLYDGSHLVLYRDNLRIGSVSASGTRQQLDAEVVSIGKITKSNAGQPLYGRGIIDNVRVERLGSVLAGRLARGIAPHNNYQVVCHPDGRTEVNGQNGDAVLEFTGRFTPEGLPTDTARITVSNDGAVRSELTKP